MDSVHRLDTLAKAVEGGEELEEQTLSRTFATGLQALGQHHAHKATEHWLEEKSIETGYDLKESALDLGHAADFADSSPGLGARR